MPDAPDDAIAAALRVAARTACCGDACMMERVGRTCGAGAPGVAAAIAAFLRALPEDCAYTMLPLPLHLAAEVERAAAGREGET